MAAEDGGPRAEGGGIGWNRPSVGAGIGPEQRDPVAGLQDLAAAAGGGVRAEDELERRRTSSSGGG